MPTLFITNERKSLALHLLGEFPLTWALAFDVAAPGNPIARAFYKIAHFHFNRATSTRRGFVPKDVFHQMRRDEARMNMLRTQWFRGLNNEALHRIDASLRHYRYLNGDPSDTVHKNLGIMQGDASRGVHLLLEALRNKLSNQPNEFRKRLDDSWSVFTAAKYGSGLYRVQIYKWILDPWLTSWWVTFPVARRRLQYALRLRNWYKYQNETSEKIQNITQSRSSPKLLNARARLNIIKSML
jgi:hypothetical protein